ncbi:CDGSH iron-sulfur domain-containing protein [Nocardia sp. NPDC048505]|uniref:CDGSH iron-sulfur domain-containing protein n=1 Tax=unclassified Nocardia TaxID=2637762 RepID=UPI0033CB4A6C
MRTTSNAETASGPESAVAERDRRRVTLVAGGPALIEGPVELVTEDGAVHTSDRFLVAVCMCKRSKTFPFCDTSHRKRVRAVE